MVKSIILVLICVVTEKIQPNVYKVKVLNTNDTGIIISNKILVKGDTIFLNDKK